MRTMAKAPENVRIYDNDGKTWDRYTIVVDEENGDRTFHGASSNPFDPQGFGQYCGENFEEGPHLGREIGFADLPEPVQRFARQRAGEVI